jgi:hypothetical protein
MDQSSQERSFSESSSRRVVESSRGAGVAFVVVAAEDSPARRLDDST